MFRILLLLALLAPSAMAQSGGSASEQALVRGLTHMRTANWDAAIAVFMEAIRAAPEEPALLVAMSEAQYASGDPESALFYSSAAASLAPDRVEVLHVHANVLLGSGRMDDALHVLQGMVDAHPTDLQAATRLLSLYLQLDRIPDAVAMDASLAAQFGAHPDLVTLRADALERAGELPRLISLLQEVAAYRNVDQRLAEAHARNNDLQAAARIWLDLLPDAKAQENLAAVVDRIADPALRAEIRAADVTGAAAPSETVPLDVRARTLLDAGRLEEAARTIEELVEKDPRQLDLWVEGVTALNTLSEWKRAAALGTDGLVLYPNYGPLVLPTAEALAADGRTAEAVAMARSALERSRESDPWTAPLRRLLTALDSPQ
ncbi:MAG: tetratricopeptide repeat protein [Rhodothermales bacterium]